MTQATVSRMTMVAAGAAAGVAVWGLSEAFSRYHVSWGLAIIAGVTMLFLSTSLSLMALIPARRAAIFATVHALVGGALLVIASRFLRESDALEGLPQVATALILFATLPLPFFAAAAKDRSAWFDYEELFHAAWDLVTCWMAALAFFAISWGVMFGSSELLKLVGIHLLDDLLEEGLFRSVVSGVMIAVGIAVAAEFTRRAGGNILLRLLRLLTPVLLVVSVIFLIALALQGAGSVRLSLTVLSALAVFAASAMISSVVAEDDLEASVNPLLLWSARGLAIVMMLMGAVSVWSIAVRVQQYGLTPERVAALIVPIVALGYGLFYSSALLRRADWKQGIRLGNTVMALIVIGLSMLWLGRVVSPEYLSVRSQIARFEAGDLAAENLPIWRMEERWGLAGQAGSAKLQALGAADPALALSLETARENDLNPHRYVSPDTTAENSADQATVAARLVSVPAEHPLLADLRVSYPGWDLGYFAKACKKTTPAGNPGCVALFADFDTTTAGDELILLALSETATASGFRKLFTGEWGRVELVSSDNWLAPTAEMIDALIGSAQAPTVPAPMQMLNMGGRYIGLTPRGGR